jgi:hypothetical protein
MRIIMDRRAQGRTTRLLDAASKLQESNDKHEALILAPYHQRAHHLADYAMERIQWWLEGESQGGVLDPARTTVDSADGWVHRNRGKRWSEPGEPHHVFAFIDDADELGQRAWDMLMDDLTVHGIVVSAAVFTSQR